MKTMTIRNESLSAGTSPLRDERGMILVIAMLILLVVSTLAGASLINSMLERSLAKNQNYASLALQAADAGINDGITWLNINMATVPDPTASPTWSQAVAVRDLSRDFNGDGDTDDQGEQLGTYEVAMRFKREWRDYNGNGNCIDPGESSGYLDGDGGTPATDCPGDIVLYNSCANTAPGCFGFSDANYTTPGSGFPVIEIDSKGYVASTSGAGFREIVFDITRNKMDLNGVKGAVTSAGAVELGPSAAIRIDGSSHDINGNPGGTCNESKPDAVVPDAVRLADSTCGNPNQNNACPNTGPVVNTGTPLCTTVECVLGYPDAASLDAAVGAGHIFGNAAAAHAQLTDSNPAEITIINGDYNENTGAGHTGILIVRGTYETQGNHQFKGLVVARQVNIHGTSDVIGAVVGVDGSVKAAVGNGTPAVLYSCDALNSVTQGSYSTRLGWHRVR